MTERQILILTGMQRSGTTFTGRMLEEVPSVFYLHEPFNPNHGLRGMPAAYPYIDDASHPFTRDIDRLFESAVSLKGKYRFWVDDDPWRKRVVRLFVNGQGDVEQWKARAKLRLGLVRAPRFLLKDPFTIMALPHLVDSYGVKAIVMVRHPVAIWRSIRRVNWPVCFKRFGGPMFRERLAREGAPTLDELDRLPEIDKAAHLWNFLYRDLRDFSARRPDHVLLVRHEDFCLDPSSEVKKLAAYLDLTATEKLERALRENTEGTIVTPDSNKLHEFRRDSRKLAWSWTESPRDDDERLRAITEREVEKLYGFWQPERSRAGG
jgi:hypothetical protein